VSGQSADAFMSSRSKVWKYPVVFFERDAQSLGPEGLSRVGVGSDWTEPRRRTESMSQRVAPLVSAAASFTGPALLVDREPSPTVTETLTAMSPALLAGLITVEPVQPRWRGFGWTALPVVAGRSGKGNTGCSSMFRAGQIHRRSSSSVILMPWQSLLSMHTTI
jgi:hypothetical protein